MPVPEPVFPEPVFPAPVPVPVVPVPVAPVPVPVPAGGWRCPPFAPLPVLGVVWVSAGSPTVPEAGVVRAFRWGARTGAGVTGGLGAVRRRRSSASRRARRCAASCRRRSASRRRSALRRSLALWRSRARRRWSAARCFARAAGSRPAPLLLCLVVTAGCPGLPGEAVLGVSVGEGVRRGFAPPRPDNCTDGSVPGEPVAPVPLTRVSAGADPGCSAEGEPVPSELE